MIRWEQEDIGDKDSTGSVCMFPWQYAGKEEVEKGAFIVYKRALQMLWLSYNSKRKWMTD